MFQLQGDFNGTVITNLTTNSVREIAFYTIFVLWHFSIACTVSEIVWPSPKKFSTDSHEVCSGDLVLKVDDPYYLDKIALRLNFFSISCYVGVLPSFRMAIFFIEG